MAKWLSYFLDNYATVDEAVEGVCTNDDNFQLVAPEIITGVKSVGHLAISDRSENNLILEYTGGFLNCWNGTEYSVMTNDPTYDQQIAINAYWAPIANQSLPGTSRPAGQLLHSFTIHEIQDRCRI